MSSRSLGTLTLDLIAKTGGFEAGMDRASRIADKRTREIEQQAKERARAIETAFSGMATAIAGPLAAALSATALAGFTRAAVDAADEMNDLSQKVGINIRDLATWKLAAEQSGTSMESVAHGVKGLSAYMVEHGDALKKAGIDATDANGAMIQLADMFKNMPDGVEKTTLAVKLFGKSGMDMIPMLNQGSEGLAAAAEAAKSYAEKLAVLAPDADKFNDTMAELRLNANALGMSLAGNVVPALNATINNFIEARKAGLGFFESLTGLGVRGLNESVSEAKTNSGKHIADLNKEIEQLEQWKSKRASLGFDEDVKKADYDIEQVKKKLELYKSLQRQLAMEQYKASYSNEGGRATSDFNPSALLDDPTKPKKSPKARTEQDPLTDAAKFYADTMERLTTAQALADSGGKSLTATQTDLVRVMSDPRFAQMPDEWRAMIAAQAEYTAQAEKVANDQRRLNELLAATPTGKLEKQRETMQFLAKAFEDGKISAEQFSEAAQTALGTIPEAAKPATESFIDMTLVANDAANQMAGAFTDYLFDPMNKSFEDMVLSFVKAIAKMIAQEIILQEVKAVTLSMGFARGGVFDQGGVKAYASGGVVNRPTPFKFASGGSFRSGVMGEAGPEAILPLKRGPDGRLGVTASGGGSGSTVVNITVNEGNTSQSESNPTADSRVLANKIKFVVLEVIAEQKRPGGALT